VPGIPDGFATSYITSEDIGVTVLLGPDRQYQVTVSLANVTDATLAPYSSLPKTLQAYSSPVRLQSLEISNRGNQ
jgi:hypothetical protein